MTPEDKADLQGDIQRGDESDQDRDAAAGIVRERLGDCEEQEAAELELRDLRAWKEQAMQVFAPIQDIGKAIESTLGQDILPGVVPFIQSLTSGGGRRRGSGMPPEGLVPEVSGCLTSGKKAAGSATMQDAYSSLLIPEGEVADTIRSHTRPGSNSVGTIVATEPVCMATGQANAEIQIGICPTLNCDHEQLLITFDPTQITSEANRSNPQPGDPCHTLAKGQHPPCIAFSCKDHGQDASEVSPTLRAMHETDGPANGGGQVAIAFDCKAGGNTGFAVGDVPGSLRGEGHGGGHAAVMTLAIRGRDGGHNLECREDGTANAILTPSGGRTATSVRRLTPLECERLQGFPDGWTKIPVKLLAKLGVEPDPENPKHWAKDGPRYKAIGNSMAINCIRLLGERIQAAHEAPTKEN